MKIKTVNINQSIVSRIEMLEGRKHLVFPVVALVEGVHNDLFYPKEEINKLPFTWNGIPVPINHPKNTDGLPVSANSPDIIDSHVIGRLWNVYANEEKLHGEIWVDMAKADIVDSSIIGKLKTNGKMEISTGLYLDTDGVEGKWNDEEYVSTASNYHPDHLAILPDTNGACNFEDGCGIRTNEISHNDLWQQLQQIVRQSVKNTVDSYEYNYVVDVFNDYFIFEKTKDDKTKYYKHNYKIKDNVASIEGEAIEVKREVKYEPVVNELTQKNKEVQKMTKLELFVNAVIEDEKTEFTVNDKEALMKMSLCQLHKIYPDVNVDVKEECPEVKANVGSKSAAQKAAEAGAGDISVKVDDVKKPTFNELLDAADDDTKEMITNGIKMHKDKKSKVIASILANANNTFTKEQLESKHIGELEAIAKLAHVEPNYEGSNGGPVGNADESVEVMETPTINWDEKK